MLTIILLIICVTLLGFPLNIMPPDAALYGSIAKEMHLNNDFVKISRDVAGVKFAHDVKWKVEIADECKNLNNIPFVMHGEITEGAGIYYMVNNIKILGWDGVKKNFGY